MSHHDETLSSRDYTRLCGLIYAESGIHLNAEKKTMLELRVKRRLNSLNLSSYARYCEYLFEPKEHKEEIVHLLDVVTTNKTDFFREPAHFNFLAARALPDLTARNPGRPLLVWSAGCSTGEEPYTLVMVMSEWGEAHPGFRFSVLATDLSTTVLKKAAQGVFTTQVVEPVPPSLRQKYLMRSRDRTSDKVRVTPELRRLVEFRRLNFMDADYRVGAKADAIFCRNVIIYFDRATQEAILRKLASNLAPQGYMFVGHSEALHGMDLPLTPVAPALYRKIDAGR
jgi:chemotaxis protein methyltransferase CheR